ncbi:SelB C-terminal domain-containing protein [Streptomyces zhihengii]
MTDAVGRLTAELAGRPFAAPAPGGSRNSASAAGSSPRRSVTGRYCGWRSTWCCCRTPPARGRPAGRTRPAVHRGAASRALETTRRVTVPLLEHCDGQGITEVLPDRRRRCADRRPPG